MSHTRIHKKIFLSFMLCMSALLANFPITHAANFIFDFGDTLAYSSRALTVYAAGITLISNWYNPFGLEKQFLKTVMTKERECAWLCGLATPQQILQEITQEIKENPGIFATPGEAAVIQAISQVIFTPERFAQTFYPIKDGIELIKKIYNQVDGQGNRIHRIFILSNFDAETFEHFKKMERFKDLFGMCDGIVVSGQMHIKKPDWGAFDYLCKTCNIDPTSQLTFFIDDSKENIDSAREMKRKRGLNHFYALIYNGNYNSIKKIFRQFNVIV